MIKEFLCKFHRFYHRTGGNGGAGKLVKNTTVFFYCPTVFANFQQIFIVEFQHPVGLFQVDFVAQSGGFAVFGDTHAGNAAIGMNTDQ